ncbi:hypothetical protein CKO51_09685 [Rhodopirellula sp. SM50]|nr:hypothetical protein CKO51_09685 [Rhodopirellula sp. SM50]
MDGLLIALLPESKSFKMDWCGPIHRYDERHTHVDFEIRGRFCQFRELRSLIDRNVSGTAQAVR